MLLLWPVRRRRWENSSCDPAIFRNPGLWNHFFFFLKRFGVPKIRTCCHRKKKIKKTRTSFGGTVGTKYYKNFIFYYQGCTTHARILFVYVPLRSDRRTIRNCGGILSRILFCDCCSLQFYRSYFGNRPLTALIYVPAGLIFIQISPPFFLFLLIETAVELGGLFIVAYYLLTFLFCLHLRWYTAQLRSRKWIIIFVSNVWKHLAGARMPLTSSLVRCQLEKTFYVIDDFRAVAPALLWQKLIFFVVWLLWLLLV